jgi:teichuronic acid biosynthesis glycosyltransferase TuaH
MPITDESGAIVLLGNVPFRSCQQRAQHLARTLARTCPVVYVNPARSFLQRWLRRSADVEPARNDRGLSLLDSPPGLPCGRTIPLINRVNCWLGRRRLRAYLRASGLSRLRVVIATFPDQWELVRRLPRRVPVLYDVMDDYRLFLRPSQRPRFRAWHRRLLARSSCVLTSSRVLLARHSAAGREVEYLGNGIPSALVRRCQPGPPLPELAALPRPRLGYLGMISSWMDFAAVAALARATRHGSVILVGPRDVPAPRLPANVHFVPAVREQTVPAVLRSFDLGLIPFVRSAAIDAVSPIKLFEYLAAGLPVLSADFREMRDYAPFVRRYRDPADAVAQAAAVLAAPPAKDLVNQRRAFAARHTWEDRASQLLHRIESVTAASAVGRQTCRQEGDR